MKKRDLAIYRYESAIEKLNAAKLLKENGFYKDSISRSYYAIFSDARRRHCIVSFYSTVKSSRMKIK